MAFVQMISCTTSRLDELRAMEQSTVGSREDRPRLPEHQDPQGPRSGERTKWWWPSSTPTISRWRLLTEETDAFARQMAELVDGPPRIGNCNGDRRIEPRSGPNA